MEITKGLFLDLLVLMMQEAKGRKTSNYNGALSGIWPSISCMLSPSKSLVSAGVLEERAESRIGTQCWLRNWWTCFSLSQLIFLQNSLMADLSSLQRHSPCPWDFSMGPETFQPGGSWSHWVTTFINEQRKLSLDRWDDLPQQLFLQPPLEQISSFASVFISLYFVPQKENFHVSLCSNILKMLSEDIR